MTTASYGDYRSLVEPDRVHKRCYTDQAIFDAEIARIFERTWIYVGHDSQVKNPGDFVATRIGVIYLGRLVEVDGIDPSKRDEVLGILRERIIPGLKEIDGFAGFVTLVDDESGRARSVILWETRESADEAERGHGEIGRGPAREGGRSIRRETSEDRWSIWISMVPRMSPIVAR